MARALGLVSPDKPRLYVLEADRALPADEQTRWFINPLTFAQYCAAQDRLIELTAGGKKKGAGSRTLVRSGTNVREALLTGLHHVENFRDEAGQEVPYPRDGGEALKLAFFDRMRAADRDELARAIMGEADLSEEEAGNSDLPSGARLPGGDTDRPNAQATASDARAS